MRSPPRCHGGLRHQLRRDGQQVRRAHRQQVYVLSKKHRGEVKDTDTYHKELADEAITIVVKGSDNSHNVQSMHGAFKLEKMASYLSDTKENKLPLLRLGRKRFPEYHFAFNGLSFMLKRQVELYEAHFKALGDQEKAFKAEKSRLIGDTIEQRRAVDQVAALQAKVDAMDAANRAINRDLVIARQDLPFQKAAYANLANGVIAAAQGLDDSQRKLFMDALARVSQTPGKQFAMPSALGLSTFKNGLGDDIDAIPGNSKPV